MAKRERENDGSETPSSNVELPGKIVTAARSTMDAESYIEGYPAKRIGIYMDQTNHVRGKR
jgi:hypothetical protein